MAPKKRPRKLRPKKPARVKKRARRAASRSHHHPELAGLVLAAFGVFLASVLYLRWNGGYVGGNVVDGVRAVIGGASYVLPVALTAVGLLMLGRSALVDVRPFRTGLAVTAFGL